MAEREPGHCQRSCPCPTTSWGTFSHWRDSSTPYTWRHKQITNVSSVVSFPVLIPRPHSQFWFPDSSSHSQPSFPQPMSSYHPELGSFPGPLYTQFLQAKLQKKASRGILSMSTLLELFIGLSNKIVILKLINSQLVIRGEWEGVQCTQLFSDGCGGERWGDRGETGRL